MIAGAFNPIDQADEGARPTVALYVELNFARYADAYEAPVRVEVQTPAVRPLPISARGFRRGSGNRGNGAVAASHPPPAVSVLNRTVVGKGPVAPQRPAARRQPVIVPQQFEARCGSVRRQVDVELVLVAGGQMDWVSEP